MSHYADYLKEAFNREVIEDERGFISFYILPEMPTVCCFLDIYVAPKFRGMDEANTLEELAIDWAREHGCQKVLGSLNMKISTPERSMKKFLKYGYKLSHVNGDFMYFIKDIQGEV